VIAVLTTTPLIPRPGAPPSALFNQEPSNAVVTAVPESRREGPLIIA